MGGVWLVAEHGHTTDISVPVSPSSSVVWLRNRVRAAQRSSDPNSRLRADGIAYSARSDALCSVFAPRFLGGSLDRRRFVTFRSSVHSANTSVPGSPALRVIPWFEERRRPVKEGALLSRIIALLCLSAVFTLAADLYVAPGAVNGTGTVTSPWSLDRALSGAGVLPGDTIWIRGGLYPGRYVSNLRGTNTTPVKVRAYPGEHPVLEGNLETTLTAAVGTSSPYVASAINVVDSTGFPIGGVLELNDGTGEAMQVTSRTATTIQVIRGWNGTCAPAGTCPAHTVGAPVGFAGGSDYLTVKGAYTWFQGLEIRYRQDTHILGINNPPWPEFSTAVNDQCQGCKYINLIIHDAGGSGIYTGALASETEVYGSLIFYNGIDANDRGHGHGIYAQNTALGPQKTFADNIIFRQFGFGIQNYGDSAYIDNMLYDSNVLFNNGEADRRGFLYNFQYGSSQTGRGLIFRGNLTYFSPNGRGENIIGWGGSLSNPATCNAPAITNSQFVNGRSALTLYCSSPTLTSNSFFGTLTGFTTGMFPGNTYLTGRPATAQVFVRPNRYESGRANIVIYNWPNLDTVAVPASQVAAAGLAQGQGFEVRDAQNFLAAPVLSGTWSGGDLMLPMTSTTITPVSGTVSVQPVHTSREFGVFVLLPAAGTTSPAPAPSVSIQVAPASATLLSGQSQQFSATVSNSTNTTVTWSASAGSITAGGLYTAPAVSSTQSVTVTATSAADPTKTASATVSVLPPVAISISPASVSMVSGQTQQFAATVSNSTNTAVAWSASAGSITVDGRYTAPIVSSAQTVTVTATSAVDSTKKASATVSVMPGVAVTVSPGSTSLTGGQIQQFTATVSNSTNHTGVVWSASAGSITSAGVYTAPAVSATQMVTVTATCSADSTKKASATVSVSPAQTTPAVNVTVSPASSTIQAGQTQQFTAAVTGSTNAAVTWSLQPQIGTISSTGLYTAPASLATATVVSVRATSVADPLRSATATINLTVAAVLPAVQVLLSPTSVNVRAGTSYQFRATVYTSSTNKSVTWSVSPAIGTISATGLYTAPSSLPNGRPVNVKVRATSNANPNVSVEAVVSLL
jgi:uncharacterized protein YjdB